MSRYIAERRETFTRYQNENGARISVAACPVLERDGYIFKDPAGCGVLEPWCDWRLSPEEQAADLPGADRRIVERFFDWAQTPEEADAAIIFIESPISDGYDAEKGYLPISLQYRPYTADTARETSLAGGDFREPDPNRSYRGRTGVCRNEGDLDLVCDARKVMGDKPVIVVIRMHHGAVLGELEPFADAIVADFGVQTEAVLTLLTGGCAPAGRLPLQLPKDMETVEAHCEDRPLDLEPYTDGCSNRYDFGFGLSWSGPLPPV